MMLKNNPIGEAAPEQPLRLRKVAWLRRSLLRCYVKRPFLMVLLLGELLAGAGVSRAQVSPGEILNPRLKTSEAKYLPQLIALNRAISAMKFPFPFVLHRYVGLDPSSSAAGDERGIEFVEFKGRVVLKITGAYGAALDADQLTENQRASRVFENVVTPILHLLPKQLPVDIPCSGVGFEIAYHVRTEKQSYDYEGYESLVVVLNKSDALGFATKDEVARQQTLDRSQIYVDGKEFGLALSARDPLNVEALERSVPHPAEPSASNAHSTAAPSSGIRAPWIYGNPADKLSLPEEPIEGTDAAADRTVQPEEVSTDAASPHTATPADAERLQAQYQPQLDATAKEGAKFHLVDYAPPSFIVFRKQIYLQLTLRNSMQFDKGSSSIYKRAAQSFDLFLAPQLKQILEAIPTTKGFTGLDITVLNDLDAKTTPSSEAVEFICPKNLLRQFVDAGITNQDLINGSFVLVNGVRIALNLQQVE